MPHDGRSSYVEMSVPLAYRSRLLMITHNILSVPQDGDLKSFIIEETNDTMAYARSLNLKFLRPLQRIDDLNHSLNSCSQVRL